MKRLLSVVVALVMVMGLGAAGFAGSYDFGGETVTIFGWDGPRGGRFAEGGWGEGLLEEAEELFNVKIEFSHFPFGEYADGFMTRLLSGDSVRDIWLMQQRQFWVLMAQGAFYPISDVVSPDYWDRLPTLSRSLAEALGFQGKTYGFGVDYGAVHPLELTVYNKDMFEREGLPDLYELYEAGEWTWDMATEIAVQATRDTSGDGEIDQWGLGGIGATRAVWFASTNDASVTREDEAGMLHFTLDEEAALEALQQVYEWREVNRVMGSGRIGFQDGQVAMYHAGIYEINMINQQMEEDFGVVPLPRGPRAEVHRYPSHALVSWVLPANVEQPEALVALQEFLYPMDEYYERLPDYIADRVRDRNSFRVLMEAHDNWEGEVWDLEYVIGSIVNPAVNEAISGTKSAAAAMSEIKPQAQAVIDELYGQ